MDSNIIISILAITISLFSLGWNIYNKIKSEKKKLRIQCHKVRCKESTNCVIVLTNIGNKPIFIRRIELEEKINGMIIKRQLDFSRYKKDFDNIPINPEHFKTLVFHDTKYFSFFDISENKFKITRIKIVDPVGNIYKTCWFGQNNFR